ncbi:MAG: hypothetical protein HC822_00540 [Oscillochloris sp.]|nr:hypothetical protein [Oscillochloris sp.]
MLIVSCIVLGVIVLRTQSASCSGFALPFAGPCMRLLFIGNSYTSVNDLPAMLAGLARSGGHRLETAALTNGGWRLADHLAATETLDTIRSSQWDYVVLQEQSQIPAVEALRTTQMYPAARALIQPIEESGATPLFFVTWGHRGGWPERGLPDYRPMQAQILQGYSALASELAVPLVPVGSAWQAAVREYPQLQLWQSDGSHPSAQGTYLAACVFYAVLFQESPEGLRYTANLPPVIARDLQQIAGRIVFPVAGE